MENEKVWLDKAEYKDLLTKEIVLGLLVKALESNAKLNWNKSGLDIDDMQDTYAYLFPTKYQDLYENLLNKEKGEKDV